MRRKFTRIYSIFNGIDQENKKFAEEVAAFNLTAVEPKNGKQLEALFSLYENLQVKSREAGAFINCLHAQNTNDTGAQLLVGKRSTSSDCIYIK